MRVHSTFTAVALATVTVLATAATAAADGEPHGIITQTVGSGGGSNQVGPLGGGNWGNGNWNRSPAFTPTTTE